MTRQYHRPVSRPSSVVENLAAGGDPAELSSVAYDTAAALLHHVRSSPDPETVEQMVAYADSHGAAEFAELWADAPPISLPGAMWRLYALRTQVTGSVTEASYIFRTGLPLDDGISPVVAGVSWPPDPTELVSLITQILRGAFTGDFGLALDRAAAFAHVMSFGASALAGDADPARGERYRQLGASFMATSKDLSRAAAKFRAGRL